MMKQKKSNDFINSTDKQRSTSRANSPMQTLDGVSSKEIEQEAPIDAVISVIEHDARQREEQEKLLKKDPNSRNETSTEPNQKNKSRKMRKKDFSDLLDLPTLNLSESDSSEDSDAENNGPADPSAENSRHSMASASEPPVCAS